MRRAVPQFLFLLLCGSLIGAGPAAACAGSEHPRRISDSDLARFAASPFDKRAKMFKREVIGVHRGTRVIAVYPCGDVCPQYTRRIIHYDVPVERCSEVGGTVAEEIVPRGPGVVRKPFCKPAVLARAAP
jgi:hypothetical protein